MPVCQSAPVLNIDIIRVILAHSLRFNIRLILAHYVMHPIAILCTHYIGRDYYARVDFVLTRSCDSINEIRENKNY